MRREAVGKLLKKSFGVAVTLLETLESRLYFVMLPIEQFGGFHVHSRGDLCVNPATTHNGVFDGKHHNGTNDRDECTP